MANENTYVNRFRELNACVIIPTFNNQRTLASVINDVKNYTDRIILVNDGSTDSTSQILSAFKGIDTIEYTPNKGKGFAIRAGMRRALEMGYDYAITIDADGQHYANDLPLFLQKMQEHPNSLIIGSRNIEAEGMPGKNTFANRFSNFWFKVETGIQLPDTQSGYRLYPIKLYRNTNFFTGNYEFEVEILVRSAWRNIPIIPIPVKVYYPPAEERVSHFRPLRDFTRISLLNTVLVLITILIVWPVKLYRYLTKNKFTDIVKEQILMHNENPMKVAVALGFGVFMGISPIWGFQMLAAAFLAHLMRLNKILVLLASNISIPPLIPFIIYFSYKTGGLVLGMQGTLTKETLINLKDQLLNSNFYDTLQELGYNLLQYVIGSLVFGVILGLATCVVSYLLLVLLRKK
jgi:glycosyltransferase involved in cell wall biosynthesis